MKTKSGGIWFYFSAILLFLFTGSALGEQEAIDQVRQKYRQIVALYLTSGEGYAPGDIITRSQIEELQSYLRKSRQKNTITHPILLERSLPDNAPLSRIFHSSPEAANALRSAAAELGGFGKLDAFSLRQGGRETLLKASQAGDSQAVVELVARESEKIDGPASRLLRRRDIYTAEDLIIVAFPQPKAPKVADSPDPEHAETKDAASDGRP